MLDTWTTILVVVSLFSETLALPTRSTASLPPQPLGTVAPLPRPTAGQTLDIIAIGLGWQNYTCVDSGTTPVAIGANATLYDATQFFSTRNGPKEIATIPDSILSDWCGEELPEAIEYNVFVFPILGHHYFSSTGTPSFDLSTVGLFLSAEKIASEPAPSNADPGPDGFGAVPWLYLAYNGTGEDVELDAVYRVETAGGSPPTTCPGPGLLRSPYAAEYWFYE